MASASEDPSASPSPSPFDPSDPFACLEDVTSETSLAFAAARNAASESAIAASPAFASLRARIRAVLDSKEKIPMIAKHGDRFYNLWKDEKNPRGLWRRTTLDSYRRMDDKEPDRMDQYPDWETVLDIDALGKSEGENWVYSGSVFLEPENRYALVYLSRGGADATVVREFDLLLKRFIPPEQGGFFLPEAKSRVAWRNRDSVFVGTAFPAGVEEDSLTDSGYPRTVREWTRGTPLSESIPVFQGEKTDVSVSAYRDLAQGFEKEIIERAVTFWTSQAFWRTPTTGLLQRIGKPEDAQMRVHQALLFLELRSDWTPIPEVTYKAGSLLATHFHDYMASNCDIAPETFHVLFTPTPRTSLASYSPLKSKIVVNQLSNVRNRIYILTPPSPSSASRSWDSKELTGFPEFCTVSVSSVDPDSTDEVFCVVSGYLTPPSLYYTDLGQEEGAMALELLKQTPAFFSTSGLHVEQHFVPSMHDGESIPYFQVSRKDLEPNGRNKTLLYGYGGFEISLTPGYQATTGVGWLEGGGVYVVANIRGGGEFGPRWHQAALGSRRQVAYKDFISVARDLCARGVTSPRYLGCMGGSNGGLLVGNMYTQYPQDFGAVVCQVPLLDMKRYSKLLAGASWMGEWVYRAGWYGNPDTTDWSYLRLLSPYHLTLPPPPRRPSILFYTSTRDDRVHPAHARKMVARLLQERGYPEALFAEGGEQGGVLYYENVEGGHGGAADNGQQAFMSALGWRFLDLVLGGGAKM